MGGYVRGVPGKHCAFPLRAMRRPVLQGLLPGMARSWRPPQSYSDRLALFQLAGSYVPDATPAMGTGAGRMIAQAMSPWFCFKDENNINLYYNLQTEWRQRDMPLHVINEPIAENVGGGLAGGRAGTWGSN